METRSYSKQAGFLSATSLVATLLVLVAAGCGAGGSNTCVITPVGSKLCGSDARTWCQQFGNVYGRTIKTIGEACAAAEGRTLHATIHVYFCTHQTCAAYATPKEIETVRSMLDSNPRVRSLKFVSREEAFAEMKEKNPGLVKGLKTNPLPDSFVVTAKTGDGKVIAASLKPRPRGVEYVRYSER
jgi:hypothetical protein